MKMHFWAWLVAAASAAGSVCMATDTVKTAKSTLPGRIAGMSPIQVELELGSGATRQIPINQIQAVFFEEEPSELRTAKMHVVGGHYSEALAALQRIKEDVNRPEIRQDIDFYTALCATKLAMAGDGKLADSGRMMKAFADANQQSYHHFEAVETVGDLLMAVGQYAPAVEYYGRLQKAPWPEHQIRANAAIGRALLAQGKIDEAAAVFDRAIGTSGDSEQVEMGRIMAKLGKAATLTAAKKPDEAVAMLEDILKTADPEDAALLARAYNVLGGAQRQAGRTKEALLAFLHVQVLYPSVSDAHAEALANLAELWEQVHNTERANRARKVLEEEYPDSPWAKKGGK